MSDPIGVTTSSPVSSTNDAGGRTGSLPSTLMPNARAEWCRSKDIQLPTGARTRHPLQRDSYVLGFSCALICRKSLPKQLDRQ